MLKSISLKFTELRKLLHVPGHASFFDTEARVIFLIRWMGGPGSS
jgi:hypothetical protein